jgi:phosphatidylserine/phosphatidylglycerophosphate/cardiolipin synthase-like enzyme
MSVIEPFSPYVGIIDQQDFGHSVKPSVKAISGEFTRSLADIPSALIATAHKVITFVLQIFEVFRAIAYLPLVGLDVAFNHSTVKFSNLSASSEDSNLIKPTPHTSTNPVQILEDPTNSYEWKKTLIQEARHSLEISGYCGGKPFQEFLDIIQEKLNGNPSFKVRIITNVDLLNDDNLEKIKELEENFPIQFETIIAAAVWGLYPSLKRHENHCKMVVADQKYCVMGGTSITNHLLPQGSVKSAGGKGAFLSDGNRDIDLVAEGDLAHAMKLEFDHLWNKWKVLKGKPKNSELDEGQTIIPTDAIALQESLRESSQCELIFSHPEEGTQNSGFLKYLELIGTAKDRVTISNMVFNHPQIIESLIQALKRGVNITIVTNGDCDQSSFASKTIGPSNRLHYEGLFQAANSDNAGKLQIFEFEEPDILLHSKVMVIDDSTSVIGSFNISKESTNCDDESIAVVHSESIAKQTLSRVEQFIETSRKISDQDLSTLSFGISRMKGIVVNTLLRDIIN